MNVVKSARLHTRESASYVFEPSETPDWYRLTKSRLDLGWCVGNIFRREQVEAFALSTPGTLIIEGGNDMKSESNVNQRTITLVTIPQEVADAIVYLRKFQWTNTELYRDVILGKSSGERTGLLITYAIDNAETLLSALVNGYTVEKSAEELAYDAIRAEYTKKRSAGLIAYPHGVSTGIAFTLDTLGIKIEGVNA